MSITTGVARASFAHLYQAVTPQGGGDPKYSVSLLIPKSDVTTIQALTAEIEQVRQANAQQFGNMAGNLKVPLYDGDGVMPSGAPWGEECRGCMVLRANSREQPAIVDLNLQPILSPNAVYSGCYVRASVNFYAYNQPTNRGIGCGLNAVQKVEDGEPLANRVSAEEAFGGANTYMGSGTPQGQSFQPTPYQITNGAGAQPAQVTYSAVQPNPAAPAAYPQQIPAGTNPNPMQQAYSQQSQPQIDPVTGRPMAPGGVMGI